mmetsp:Transcript_30871/g.35669  ORF Transcript_30871/g.35669 Transcript_30871/m.35669 type:complete len:220 (-) Transcript_30871:323-982(-)
MTALQPKTLLRGCVGYMVPYLVCVSVSCDECVLSYVRMCAYVSCTVSLLLPRQSRRSRGSHQIPLVLLDTHGGAIHVIQSCKHLVPSPSLVQRPTIITRVLRFLGCQPRPESFGIRFGIYPFFFLLLQFRLEIRFGPFLRFFYLGTGFLPFFLLGGLVLLLHQISIGEWRTNLSLLPIPLVFPQCMTCFSKSQPFGFRIGEEIGDAVARIGEGWIGERG